MILDKLKNTIKRHNLIKKGEKLVIGVSGGPDSVALLYLLNSLKKQLHFSLYIAHLDHMLRKDSYKDREFVEGLAEKLRLPITTAQINVKELIKKGSVEEVARNVRLGFLFRAAGEVNADKIALGHTQDDQAETVLMRILRGAGLYGLAGILPKRKIEGMTIIRPLIEVSREEIERYLRRRKIKSRLDASNLEDIYLRNRVRNKLLPLLEREYNSNIKKVLANMAESIGADYEYLRRVCEGKYSQIRYSRSGGSRRPLSRININLKKFLRLHPAIQRLVIRLAISKIKGDTRRLSFQHMKEIEDLIFNRPINSVVDLPASTSIIKKKNCLSLYKKTQ